MTEEEEDYVQKVSAARNRIQGATEQAARIVYDAENTLVKLAEEFPEEHASMYATGTEAGDGALADLVGVKATVDGILKSTTLARKDLNSMFPG